MTRPAECAKSPSPLRTSGRRQEGRTRIASLIVKTKSGNRVLPFSAISSIAATTKTFHDRTPVGLPDAVEFEGAVIDLCLDRNDLSLDRADMLSPSAGQRDQCIAPNL
jgi:hypothetical protein